MTDRNPESFKPKSDVRTWPVSDTGRADQNVRNRGVAAVGSVKLSGSKESISAIASNGVSTYSNNVRQVQFRLGQTVKRKYDLTLDARSNPG